MRLALVTGTRPHLGPAAATLTRAGFEVTTWEVGAPPPSQGPVDCYLQLPCAGTATDLVCRTDTLAAVASRLRPDASVLLAVDEPDPTDWPSTTLAPDLLAAVAVALLEDLGRPSSRLAVVPLAAFARLTPAALVHDADEVVLDLTQWEIPTPPLVPAP